ncbi:MULTISPECIES: hypothetical protein [unclassified Leifsonia]|uniref:hypothetical protein n=1 Tax=unclassified Leifsonia TaxID=2663824 RepID=UPI000360AE8F|nr:MULTISPECIES: hypothetical protein [unclassified Leifsonia]TDP99824.1 hypothetical protein AXZ95_3750 [Leifsonia sp. 115AMFTsu3.1]
MIEALHLGSMLPATLGACCVAGSADRRSPLAWFGMLAMLAAMADTMLLPHPVVAPVVWAALLVATGVATAVALRLRPAGRGGARDAQAAHPAHPARAMALHRALQAILTGGLIVAAGAHHGAAGGGHSAHGVNVIAALGVAALAFAVASGLLAFRRRLPPLPRAEAALGAASVALMSLPLLA